MAASSRSPQTESTASRKLAWLTAGVIVVSGLYTAGWYGLAHYARPRLEALLAGGGNGVVMRCDNLAIQGFPFRLGLFCDGFSADDSKHGLALTAGPLRSAAQVYAPWHLVGELDGPLSLRSSAGLTVTADWTNLKSSLVLSSLRPSRVAAVASNATVTFSDTRTGQAVTVKGAGSELHARGNGPDLDLAVIAEAVSTDWQPLASFAAMAMSGDLTLKDKAGWLSGNELFTGSLRGLSGEARRVVVDLGEGRVATLTGPFSVDADGLVSGKLSIDLEKVEGWQAALTTMMPEAAETIDTGGKALSALSQGGKVRLELFADKGQLTLGFIPLGQIPPLR